MQEDTTEEIVVSTENTMEVQEADLPIALTNFPEIKFQDKFTALEQAKVTMKAFRDAERLRGMALASLDDKDSYKQLYNAHQFLKGLAATIKKVCKEGRDPHVKQQKEWIALEESLTDWVEEIATPIGDQRKSYEDEQARRKAEEAKRLEARTNARGREMQQLGVPFDLLACQNHTEEQWEAFLAPHREAQRLRELGMARAKQAKAYDVVMSPEDAAANSDEEWATFMDQLKEAHEAEQERQREIEAMASRRLEEASAIGYRLGADDARELSEEEFQAIMDTRRQEIEQERQEAEARKERERRDREEMEKYRKRFEFVVKAGYSLEQVGMAPDQLKAMTDEEFLALVRKVNQMKSDREEKERIDAEERRKDEVFRTRYNKLVGIGFVFTPDLGTQVREASEEEFQAIWDGAKAEYDRKQEDARIERERQEAEARQERERADQAKRDRLAAEQVATLQAPPEEQHADEPEAMPETDPASIMQWIQTIRNEVEFPPAVNDGRAQAFHGLRSGIIDLLDQIVDLFPEVR